MKNKIIIVGGSMKYRSLIMDAVDGLRELGFDANCPNTNRTDSSDDKAKNKADKLKLAFDHYRAIEKADAVYFVCPDGYFGNSCKLELGYALAFKKPIYFSEETGEMDLDCYVNKFISIDNLNLLEEALK